MSKLSLLTWLNKTVAMLEAESILTARLDCLVLLEDILGKDRSWLLAHPEHMLENNQIKQLDQLIQRRAKHEPLAYIRGKSEFYGREFIVSAETLEPRPESETIINLLKTLKPKTTNVIVDVGTGSGCLAITTKLELPHSEVIAIDISTKALAIAKNNAKKHNAIIECLHGNLLEPLESRQLANSILICNLPYVPDNHVINQAAMFEPKLAIFGGADGLDLYRQLFLQIAKNLQFEGAEYVITESLPTQHKMLATIAKQAGYALQKTDDFIQVFSRTA